MGEYSILTARAPFLALFGAALVTAPASLQAKTTTSTIIARTLVDTACKLQTTNLTFGSVQGKSGQLDATTILTLSCGPSVAYSVAIDSGQNYNGRRRMYGFQGKARYVDYEIYRDAARTQIWGATPTTTANGTTPADGKVTLTVYGRIPNTKVFATVYIDTVAVTVNF